MAGGAQQFPRTNFPLAEYFALAPNANVALGPRLTKSFQPPNITVPPSSPGAVCIASVPLLPSFSYGDAIFVARAWGIVVLGDATGHLTINGGRLCLGSTGTFVYDLAVPLSVFSSPTNTQLVMQDRESLIHFDDLNQLGFPPGGPLILQFSLVMSNADTASHQFVGIGFCTFHSLKGLTT